MPENGEEPNAGSLIQGALEWSYEKAIAGFPPMFLGAEELAIEYKKNYNDPEAALDALIKWASAEAGLVGFVTGIGGLATLPVSLPTNIASVLAIQLRLAVAVACLRGYGAHDHQTKTLALATLLGGGAVAALEEAGVVVGAKLTANLIAQIPGAALREINKIVGMRLVTRAGTTGVVNLSKFVPIVGGLVGAGIDAGLTYGLAQAAKALFPPKELNAEPPDVMAVN